jgi:Phage P22-like portal protein
MSTVPYKKDDEELKRIKKDIESAYMGFKHNYDRYNNFRRSIFVSTVSTTDTSINKILNRPDIEANILEPNISRLVGQFAKHQPAVRVSAIENFREWDERVNSPEKIKQRADTVEAVEGHLKYLLFEASKLGFQDEIITDTLSGGFSAGYVYTDYKNPRSFEQDIFIKRTFDPTMTYWDLMAREPDKGDARFCGYLIPMHKDEFVREFGEVKAGSMQEDSFNAESGVGPFRWSYAAGEEEIMVVAHHFEKKIKKAKIMELANGKVMTAKEYEQFLRDWNEAGYIEQAPVIVGKPRMTTLTTICHYKVSENKLLEYEETDYAELPIIFADGNSQLIKDTLNTEIKQFTRPIVYHAMGIQRLKNMALQSLANELENIQQSPWMIAKESIPAQYKDPWTSPQLASCLVYNAFKDDDPKVPLPIPQMVQRRPIPPEIMQTVMTTDTIMQTILGAFDSSIARLGERDVSGIAIQESLSLSNAAAQPYVNNYMQFLQSVCNLILKLIPKIYVTPRTIPVLTKEGKKDFVVINDEGGISFDYDENVLQVKVEPGPSFGQQQAKAFEDLVRVQKENPGIAQFMAMEGGEILFDNMEFKGIDRVKEKYEIWQQEMKQMQQKQQQQPNPEQMKMQLQQQELQQKAEQQKMENQLKMLQMQLEVEKLEVQKAEILASIENQQSNAKVQLEKSHTERISKAAELILKKEDLEERRVNKTEKAE